MTSKDVSELCLLLLAVAVLLAGLGECRAILHSVP